MLAVGQGNFKALSVVADRQYNIEILACLVELNAIAVVRTLDDGVVDTRRSSFALLEYAGFGIEVEVSGHICTAFILQLYAVECRIARNFEVQYSAQWLECELAVHQVLRSERHVKTVE